MDIVKNKPESLFVSPMKKHFGRDYSIFSIYCFSIHKKGRIILAMYSTIRNHSLMYSVDEAKEQSSPSQLHSQFYLPPSTLVTLSRWEDRFATKYKTARANFFKTLLLRIFILNTFNVYCFVAVSLFLTCCFLCT